MIKYLIVQDERNTPCIPLLPARDTKEEAQKEVDRMNEVVKKNNETYEIKQTTPYYKGKCFMFRQDKRIFGVMEIETNE